ncbi:MAG: hypothetical protein CL878_10750 [Dehalococcoidia bacterium]|nr:hypothetical protein [Dehalococcoidia bacterium]
MAQETSQPSNWGKRIDRQPALREAVAIYREICGDSLIAFYARGSAHRGEAVFGLSDLDDVAYVTQLLSDEALERLYALSDARLEPWGLTGKRGLGRPRTLDWQTWGRPDASDEESLRYKGATFSLSYDATRVYGQDVLLGYSIPVPDAAFAREYLRTGPLETIRLATGGKRHREFPLPEEPEARLRKLGRLAVLSGAMVLIARSQFRSLRGPHVLPVLETAEPRWTGFLQDTARCYIEVQPDAPDYDPYLGTLAQFAEWCWQEVSES